ncbi:MAG: response regulator [Gammaproteobacteria bacterium]|nr:response regulator [Gammaproteobacteria bacterium]
MFIDDEEEIREGMRETLTKWGCIALITSSGDNAVKQIKIQGYQPEVILSDYRLQEGKNGVEAIHQVYQVMEKKVPAMIITGDTDRERLREASDSGYT